MTKTQKAEIIDLLTSEFKTAQAVIFCDYKGLSVCELEDLRKIARSKEAKVQVVKNTLATISLKNADLENSDEINNIKTLISSMTKKERTTPSLINTSIKRSIFISFTMFNS